MITENIPSFWINKPKAVPVRSSGLDVNTISFKCFSLRWIKRSKASLFTAWKAILYQARGDGGCRAMTPVEASLFGKLANPLSKSVMPLKDVVWF